MSRCSTNRCSKIHDKTGEDSSAVEASADVDNADDNSSKSHGSDDYCIPDESVSKANATIFIAEDGNEVRCSNHLRKQTQLSEYHVATNDSGEIYAFKETQNVMKHRYGNRI